MNSRRNFLQKIGLASVAAPIAVPNILSAHQDEVKKIMQDAPAWESRDNIYVVFKDNNGRIIRASGLAREHKIEVSRGTIDVTSEEGFYYAMPGPRKVTLSLEVDVSEKFEIEYLERHGVL